MYHRGRKYLKTFGSLLLWKLNIKQKSEKYQELNKSQLIFCYKHKHIQSFWKSKKFSIVWTHSWLDVAEGEHTDGTVGVRMSSNRLYVILWLTCWCPVLPVHVSADARVQVLTADPAGKKQTPSLLFWARATGCPGSTGLQADPSPDPEKRQTTSGTSASMTCSFSPHKNII